MLAGTLFFVGTAYTVQAIINWKIDSEKAMVKFTMRAHGQELIGNFKGAKGEIKFDEKDLANSSVNCTVDITTVNTGIGGRDKHLQAKGFFDAAGFPVGSFISAKIEKSNEGFIATGNFSLKGTTKEIAIPFLYEGTSGTGNDTGMFKGSFSIKRSEYSIGKPDEDISDEVTITLEIPVTKE